MSFRCRIVLPAANKNFAAEFVLAVANQVFVAENVWPATNQVFATKFVWSVANQMFCGQIVFLQRFRCPHRIKFSLLNCVVRRETGFAVEFYCTQ